MRLIAITSAVGMVAALSALPAQATSIKAGPGVDVATKTITLGEITPLSGSVALIGDPLTAGEAAYFDYVNGHGGIGGTGWKVKLDALDDQYDPQMHVQDYNELVNKVAAFSQSLGSPTTQAIETPATRAGVLLGTAAQDSAFVNHNINLVIGSPYAVDVANSLYYLTQVRKVSDPKVAIFYQNDSYGQDGIKGYDAALSAYHFKDVGRFSYNETDTSFTSQATGLKESGAKYVVLTAIPTAAATLIGTAAAEGYHPQWILQGPAWSEYLMTSTGTSSGKPTPVEQAMVGAWVLGFEAAWGDMSEPGMAQFLKITKEYEPKQIPDGYYMYGYCMAEAVTAVLAKSISRGVLTRSGILYAKEHLGTVNFGGLIPAATYDTTNGPATRMTDIAQVDTTSPGFLHLLAGYMESSVAKNMTFAAG